MAIAEGVDESVERRMNEGVEHGGRMRTAGSDTVPPGTRMGRRGAASQANPQAVNAVIAGALHETGVMTRDEEYLQGAVDAGRAAGEVGVPAILDEDDIESLASGSPALGFLRSGPATPVAMTAPTQQASLLANVPPPTNRVEEVPELEEELRHLDLSPDLDDEMLAFLDEDIEADADDEDEEAPDTEEADEEYVQEPEQFDPGYDDGQGFADPQTEALQRELAKAQKRIEHLEKRDQKRSREKWGQDAARFPAVPGARAREIAEQSSSRQDFVRRMKRENDVLEEHVRGLLGQTQVRHADDAALERERARAEARAAWGEPVSAAPVSADVPDDMERNLRRARERDGLAGQMTEKLRSGLWRFG